MRHDPSIPELAVLGAAMLDGAVVGELADVLEPHHFLTEPMESEHHLIAMLLLYELVTAGTAEQFTSERRREHSAYDGPPPDRWSEPEGR